MAAGLYGKLPALGDFVARGLPPSVVQRWDGWLSPALQAARDGLGTGFLEPYLNGPIWRFLLGPGVCGDASWAGIMAPSTDKVGRCFPLTLLVTIPEGVALSRLARDWRNGYGRLEALALSLLDGSGTLDEALTALQAIADDTDWPRPAERGWAAYGTATGNMAAWRLGAIPGRGIETAFLTHGLDIVLDASSPPTSLWWHRPTAVRTASALLCRPLPPQQGFAAFLNGAWSDHDWPLLPEPTPGTDT